MDGGGLGAAVAHHGAASLAAPVPVGADEGLVLHPGTREDPAHGARHQAAQRADIVSI